MKTTYDLTQCDSHPEVEEKIGRIIKRNNWFLYLGKRTKYAVRKDKKRVFGYGVKDPGDLFQVDTFSSPTPDVLNKMG